MMTSPIGNGSGIRASVTRHVFDPTQRVFTFPE